MSESETQGFRLGFALHCPPHDRVSMPHILPPSHGMAD
jgi:hypothetical protein